MYFDVFGSFQLFLACSVNVGASGIFIYTRKINLGAQKRSRETRGDQKYLFNILGGNEENGGSEVTFSTHPKKGSPTHPPTLPRTHTLPASYPNTPAIPPYPPAIPPRTHAPFLSPLLVPHSLTQPPEPMRAPPSPATSTTAHHNSR